MDRGDVQGLVFHGYGRQPSSRFYLLRFDQAEPREWLRRVIYDVSSALESEHEPFRFNLAFSASGLRALGLGEATLATFPREFLQGMAHPERSIALGDLNEDAPEHWEFGGSAERRVDALALLYAPNQTLLEERAERVEDAFERFDVQFVSEDVRLSEDGKEHFGFADGISQPHIRGSRRKRPRKERSLPAGEFLLGHKNAYGRLPLSPRAPFKRGTREMPPLLLRSKEMDLGHSGSFLVLRKLEQRVADFWRYAAEAARSLDETNPELCAARLIGRWPSGAPLVLSPSQDEPPNAGLNEFSFAVDDPHGHRCPLGAHIRRANPRDMLGSETQRHRIVRRGRIYGPKLDGTVDDGRRRGLYFVALNANIRRQFEFIQQTWLNGSKFGGLFAERDPLLGKDERGAGGEAGERAFSIQGEIVRRRLVGLPRFVRVRGGEYFFLPGLRALNYLAEP